MSNPSDQLKELVAKVEKTLKKVLKSKSFYDDLGEFVSNQIRKRTRIGKGVSPSGNQTKLNPLKPSTKKYREKYKKNLSENTRAGKSNLTATGQLLDSIEYKSTNAKTKISFADKRSKELSGAASTISNSKVAGYVQKAGRRFFGLTTGEQNELKRIIEKKIQEITKRLK